MASYLELCEDCDRLPQYPDTCYNFLIEGYDGVFGHVIEPIVKILTWNEHWHINHDEKTVKLLDDSLESRKETLNNTLVAERDKGTLRVLKKWTGERFPVYGPNHELVLEIERSASVLFGIATYAVQLIVYRDDPEGLSIWVARRSPTKTLYPNRLGVTVSGGLPAGESPRECLVREAYKEASLPSEMVSKDARSVGTISYVTTTETKTTSGGEPGLIHSEIQFVYDLKVGPDVVPTPYDMEASEISLYSMDEIKKALNDGEFTPINACLRLDFFIRHGLVTFENEKDYTQIVSRLHRPLGMHTA